MPERTITTTDEQELAYAYLGIDPQEDISKHMNRWVDRAKKKYAKSKTMTELKTLDGE
jgi:hypothetical protein